MAKITKLSDNPLHPVSFNFNDVEITCPVEQGHRMIPIRTVCQIIDVDFARQDNWLKKHPIYSQLYNPMPTVGADNKARTMNCLSFFDTYGWLNSITQKGRKPGSYEKQQLFMVWLREKIMALYKAIEQVEAENKYERELLQQKQDALNELEERQAKVKELKKQIAEIDKAIEQINIDKVTGQVSLFSSN